MRRTITALLILLLVSFSSVHAQDTTFSADNAYAVLKTLVEYYGPRPMGSPAEQGALVHAVAKFGQYGCQESYVMPMTVADGVNTTSGIAVGILRGKTNRIIVIGGHIDSSDPEVPGANDDGSGVACVIELARVLGQRKHESTIVFCAWGGEEDGLRGSTYFVEHFKEIDSVALMLQIDMADGASVLYVDPDGERISAPTWLTKAAYDVFYRDLHYEGLIFPVHGANLNWAIGSPTGSDHAAFLDKGIPAICFTSDVNYPIHTPQDNLENFTASGLKRPGDLVLKLVGRFDKDIPPRSTEKYMVVQVGVTPFFLTYWLLWTVTAICVLVGLATFAGVRRRRVHLTELRSTKWSGLKLLLAAFIVQVFMWFSENIVGLINNYRFPWVNNFEGFVLLGILCGFISLWLMLRTFHFSVDEYVYARVAFILLFTQLLLLSIGGPKLAVYPASGLFFFSLAMRTQRKLFKLIFSIAAPYLMIRLVFHDYLGLIQRSLTQNTVHSLSGSLWYNFSFVIGFWLLWLPFVFAFAAVYRSSGADLFLLKKLRTLPALIVALGAASGLVAYLSAQPVYDRTWFSLVRAEQQYTAGADSSSIALKGSEFLKGMHMRLDEEESVFEDRTNFAEVHPAKSTRVDWCSIVASGGRPRAETKQDSLREFERLVEVRSRFRPLRVRMTFHSSEPLQVNSIWSHGRRGWQKEEETATTKVFNWYSFPDSVLIVPITFSLRDSQKVYEKIEVTFDSLAYPLRLRREHTNFFWRTIVTATDTFSLAHTQQSTTSVQ